MFWNTLSDLNNCVLARASKALQTSMSRDNLCLGAPRQSRVPGSTEENWWPHTFSLWRQCFAALNDAMAGRIYDLIFYQEQIIHSWTFIGIVSIASIRHTEEVPTERKSVLCNSVGRARRNSIGLQASPHPHFIIFFDKTDLKQN